MPDHWLQAGLLTSRRGLVSSLRRGAIAKSAQKIDWVAGENGMTLVEAVVSMVLIVTASMIALNMTGIAGRLVTRSKELNQIEALVDTDFSALERAAFNYTYCTGSFTWDGRDCGTDKPGKPTYYFPAVSTTSDLNARNFEQTCLNNTVNTALLNAINGSDATLGLGSAAQSQGVTRDAVIDSANPARVMVTYSLNRVAFKRFILIPAVVYWCPDLVVSTSA